MKCRTNSRLTRKAALFKNGVTLLSPPRTVHCLQMNHTSRVFFLVVVVVVVGGEQPFIVRAGCCGFCPCREEGCYHTRGTSGKGRVKLAFSTGSFTYGLGSSGISLPQKSLQISIFGARGAPRLRRLDGRFGRRLTFILKYHNGFVHRSLQLITSTHSAEQVS